MKKLLLLLDCLLAGLVVWTVVSLFVLRPVSLDRGKPSPIHQEGQRQAPSLFLEPKPIEDFKAVVDQDIFGTPRAVGGVAKGEEGKIKPTALRLKLNGTIIGDGKKSYAILLDGQTKKQEVYMVNEFVHGARILQIQPDKVILSVAGVKEALDMNMEAASPGGSGVGKSQGVASPSRRAGTPAGRPARGRSQP